MAFLWDHHVQGTILLPAAMLLEVATCSAFVCTGTYEKASRRYETRMYICIKAFMMI